MRRQTRSRRRAKRKGLLLCVITLAAWELSLWCECTYCTGNCGVGVARGITWFAWRHPGAPSWEPGLHLRWGLQFVERILPGFWHFGSGTALQIPFSVPFVLLAAPTAYLWWRERRRRVSRLSRGMRLWKRIGTAACVVTVSAMVFSMHVVIGIQWGCHRVHTNCGAIEVAWVDGWDEPPYGWPRFYYSPRVTDSAENLWWAIREFAFWPGSSFFASDWDVHVPLWMPLLPIAIPTVVLWRRDWQPLPGYCQACGYNLTGNTSGRCPECGTETGRPDSTEEPRASARPVSRPR